MVEWWLRSTESDTVISALNYLSECGLTEDIEAIDAHLDSSEATVSKAAVGAKINILARESIEKALEFTASREDAEIPRRLALVLLANPVTIETRLLRRCLANRSTEFRRIVAGELLRRDALESEHAKLLTESSDTATRVVGAKALRKLLLEFSLADARTLIVKPKKQNGILPEYDHEGEEKFAAYKHELLCEKKYEDLVIMRNEESVYTHDISFAMYDRYFKLTSAEIIANIKDDFQSFIANKRKTLQNPLSGLDEKLESFLRETMLYKALGLLCSKKAKGELPLIRQKVDVCAVPYSVAIVEYFGKFGGWNDVDRIIKLCTNFPFKGYSLLSAGGQEDEYGVAAKVMLRLADGRVADLLVKEMPSELRKAVFASMNKSLFNSFDDAQIERWLGFKDDSVRQSVSVKAVLSLPKSRITKILTSYIEDGKTYFYNVVFWLDLGVAADRQSAVTVAGKFSMND
ncbi:hypothetical protein U8P75_23955 [Rhizobium beringeri]|nr:hypothetical protein U8P75_23955 [Rhizobium beringeri]